MMRGSRLRQIGWFVVLTVCITCFVALTFRVNAVKSEVRLAERQVVALEREKILLETEFQTRANQQQLANWNRVDFGYAAPQADQYLENERELAVLGLPRNAGAPDPIRVARAPLEGEEASFAMMVSPLTGKHVEEAEEPQKQHKQRNPMSAPRTLADRLSLEGPVGGVGVKVSE